MGESYFKTIETKEGYDGVSQRGFREYPSISSSLPPYLKKREKLLGGYKYKLNRNGVVEIIPHNVTETKKGEKKGGISPSQPTNLKNVDEPAKTHSQSQPVPITPLTPLTPPKAAGSFINWRNTSSIALLGAEKRHPDNLTTHPALIRESKANGFDTLSLSIPKEISQQQLNSFYNATKGWYRPSQKDILEEAAIGNIFGADPALLIAYGTAKNLGMDVITSQEGNVLTAANSISNSYLKECGGKVLHIGDRDDTKQIQDALTNNIAVTPFAMSLSYSTDPYKESTSQVRISYMDPLKTKPEDLLSTFKEAQHNIDETNKMKSSEALDLEKRLGKGITPSDWHRHPNGGGWVEKTAKVDNSAFIGRNAIVAENAQVLESAVINGKSVVTGNSSVKGNSTVLNSIVKDGAKVDGLAKINSSTLEGESNTIAKANIHNSTVGGFSTVAGDVSDNSHVHGRSIIGGNAKIEKSDISGNSVIQGVINNSTISGDALVQQKATICDGSELKGHTKVENGSKISNSLLIGGEDISRPLTVEKAEVHSCQLEGDVRIKEGSSICNINETYKTPTDISESGNISPRDNETRYPKFQEGNSKTISFPGYPKANQIASNGDSGKQNPNSPISSPEFSPEIKGHESEKSPSPAPGEVRIRRAYPTSLRNLPEKPTREEVELFNNKTGKRVPENHFNNASLMDWTNLQRVRDNVEPFSTKEYKEFLKTGKDASMNPDIKSPYKNKPISEETAGWLHEALNDSYIEKVGKNTKDVMESMKSSPKTPPTTTHLIEATKALNSPIASLAEIEDHKKALEEIYKSVYGDISNTNTKPKPKPEPIDAFA